jgi:hypothetical protein
MPNLEIATSSNTVTSPNVTTLEKNLAPRDTFINRHIAPNQAEITKIEQLINGKLNQNDIKNYSIRNEEVLKEKLNIRLDDLSGNKWIKILYDYVSNCLQT